MTRLAIIFSLLFVAPAWAGEVDGNSFYCTGDKKSFFTKKKYEDKVLEFVNEEARLYSEHPSLLSPNHEPNSAHSYTATPVLVHWAFMNWYTYYMNRKDLSLELLKNEDRSTFSSWSCEFMEINEAKKKLFANWQETERQFEDKRKKKEEEKKRLDAILREGNQF